MKILPSSLIILALASQQNIAAQSSRPNIIYIMADDLGYADLSCYGRKDYQTPHLDKLASQGVKFMNAYAAGPLCTPTRAAFMTGRYPARTTIGLLEPLRGRPKDSAIGLTADITSFPSILRKNGYNTFLVGKWHLGFGPEHTPNKNGYDYFFGFNAGGTDYVSHSNRFGKSDLYENEKAISKDGYLTDLWMEKAVEILKQKHEKPFFLSIMFNAPHWPWQAPGDSRYPDTLDWKKGGSKEKFAAMVKSMDDAVGRIMQTVDDEKLAANTVVIFTSDNGGEIYSDMGIYAGRKEQLWDGGIREPAFVRWPGEIPANSVTQQLSITMDWPATILALAKASPDPAFPLDGIDLMPFMTGKKTIKERTFYWRLSQSTKQKAIRDGKWKYLKVEDDEFLFNLIDDPGEKKDLKLAQPSIFKKLKEKYEKWEREMLEPIPL
jgi:arylsulfatase A-like enzyme